MATSCSVSAPSQTLPNEPYQYDTLPSSKCIRILKINSLVEDHIVVSLKTVDLTDNPSYHALSYTWGNPHANGVDFTENFNQVADEYSTANRIPIICDGNVLFVGQNLYDALCQLPRDLWARGRVRTDLTSTDGEFLSPDIYMWIDALCINQQDFAERSAQVQIMDLIYEKAAYTVIWFGRADKYTEDAAGVISKVAAYPRTAFAQSDVIPFRNQDPVIYERSNLPYTSWMEWCSLAAFLKRQWFSRLWIIQESILSQELIIFCGEYEVVWDELCTAARNIQARCEVYGNATSTIFIAHDDIAVTLEFNLLKLKEWRDSHHGGEDATIKSFSFENLTYDTWTFVSTDPRDKIYGLFGLMSKRNTPTWHADYKMSVEECFAEVTRRIIEESNSLKILSCVQDASQRKIGEYPSWVPDFSVPYFNMMSSVFAAAGVRSKAQILPSISWDRLRLRASFFDEIVEVAAERTNYVNSAMLLDPSWFELTMLLKQPYVTGQPRTEVLWRTLCADQDSSFNSPAPAGFSQLFRQFVSAMIMVRADLEADVVAEGNANPNCSGSFASALEYVREFWAANHFDTAPVEHILTQFSQRPRFMNKPEQGWLTFTLLKLEILAATEDDPCTPDLAGLERFHQNPTYVMRNSRKALLAPREGGFFNSFVQRYGRRKLFYTKSGYLGLGPAATAVGDQVYITAGAGGPLVCRRYRSSDGDAPERLVDGMNGNIRLQFIGESYVHGIMHGEVTKMDGYQSEEVEIM